MKRPIAIIALNILLSIPSVFAVEGGAIGPSSWLSISEFSAVNDKGFATQVHGEEVRVDWIEIHNAFREPINLSGWYLTDDPENLTLWAFPDIFIAPRENLLVWASGIKEEDHPENWPYVDDLGYFHTNFRLSSGGDYLALVNPDLEVVHEYASHEIEPDRWGFPPQREGVSYGVCQDGQTYLPLQTPGEDNLAECLEQCEAPVFSHAAGPFVEAFTLELTCPTEGADIYYNLDGAEPTNPSNPGRGVVTWIRYLGPIEINRSVEIVARAEHATLLPSAPANRSYLALSGEATSFSSNLPIIVVDTGGRSVSSGAFRLVKTAFIDTDASGRAHMTGTPDFVGRGGLHIRGSSSSGFAKKQYAFETWDLDQEDLDVSILGFPEESDWILYGPSQFDLAIINNALIYELSNQAGRYAPRTRFCEMYLNTDDGTVSERDYIGIYILMEKINRDRERVAVEKLEPWDSTEPRASGGYILSIDRAGDGGFSAAGQTFVHVYPKGEDLIPAQANWIRGYMTDLNSALHGSDFMHPEKGYAKYLDVDSFIDHHILNLLPLNVDAFRLSGYMHKTREGKLELGPIWDFDRSMNSTDGRDDNPRQWSYFLTWYWWDRLFQDPHFWIQYIDRWFEFRNTVFSMENINAVIDSMVEEISEAQPRNRARWPQYGPRYGSFDGEITALKDWLETRALWIDSEFVRPPVLDVTTGRLDSDLVVTLENPNDSGTIFYTLDGSDPWVPEINDDSIPTTILAQENAAKNILVPSAPVDDAWKGGETFDDSAWTVVKTRGGFGGVGYDLGADYGPMISMDLQSQMLASTRGGRTSCYVRIPFILSGTSDLHNSLTLQIRYDDGFVAYLNGVEVARSGFVGEPMWYSKAGSENNGLLLEDFDITDFKDHLISGVNVLAIHGLNISDTSSDFLISAQLVSRELLVGPGIGESLAYTGPITLTQSAEIKARVRQVQHPMSRWGGLTHQVFSVGQVQESLRVSELMYHPEDTGHPQDPNAEYIELTNIGDQPINLNQVKFTSGVEFVFPDWVLLPNEYCLVVKDEEAYAAIQDANLTGVVGAYTGSLSNRGERIALVAADGQEIQRLKYEDGWFDLTDGLGLSLTMIDPADPRAVDSNDKDLWRTSVDIGGSPGWDDSL